ncbi:MAG: NAD-dependent epimerase/dehydratase family protein, partial [Bacteroidetes bacterium]|nr:NAD-dependent epimerase/dehydratase family protein [Bacteroidota bacterium]
VGGGDTDASWEGAGGGTKDTSRRETVDGVTLRLWGSGSPLREFLHVNDMAEACLFVMENIDTQDLTTSSPQSPQSPFLNIGSGTDLSINNLADLVKEIIGFQGDIQWDRSKPDGTPRKLMDISRLTSLGWKYKISLQHGILQVFKEYVK